MLNPRVDVKKNSVFLYPLVVIDRKEHFINVEMQILEKFLYNERRYYINLYGLFYYQKINFGKKYR